MASDLQKVTQTLIKLGNEFGASSQFLEQYSKRIQNQSLELQSILDKTSTDSYNQIASSLFHAVQLLNKSVIELVNAQKITDNWLQIHGSLNGTNQIQSYMGSAANSYGRAIMSKEEADVYVRMESNLSNIFLDQVPDERRELVNTAYASAPDYIIAIINQHSSKLNAVHKSLQKGDCYYSPADRWIMMDDNMNDAEYSDVIKHEIGHFIDHMMGTPSDSKEFIDAMELDYNYFETSTPKGYQHMNDMLDDLFSTGACFDRNVTDILSALFRNHPMVKQRFFDESVTGYVANYVHQDKYWDTCDENGRSLNKRGKEIFANSFAIETDGYRISKNFVERWFPHINEQMGVYMQRGAR